MYSHVIVSAIYINKKSNSGHGKKIHCFSGKTFPNLEAVAGSFFSFF